jgi:glycosyltransferase involved in cell wall biosynthesis
VRKGEPRVGLVLLTLVPGELGGSETYVRSLAAALARRSALDVTAYVPPLAADAGDGLPSTVVDEYRSGTSPAARLRAMALGSLRAGRLRDRLEGLDVVHYPLTVPLPAVRGPWATTLHDVQHLDLPQLFSAAERAYRRLAYDRTVRRAHAVIVISEFVRERAVERLGLDPDRVHVAPLGVDRERFHPGEGTRDPFVLFPARGWPHKNHARLLEAWPHVRRERPDLRLVLTGGGLDGVVPVEGVEVRGNVTLDQLAGLYRRAACLVFPSRYEGFGLPPLEAMASGCPVAAARAGAIPEVTGDAAVLFDPDDPEAIAAGVLEALDRAGELAVQGLERAAAFTWEACAERHEAVYRSLASTRS